MGSIRRRGLADPIGFAHLASQMDRVAQRIAARDGARLARTLAEKGVYADDRWRMAIAPHDDYAYAGFMYPLALRNVKARTVVIFGVAHRARQQGLEDVLVFDDFTHWRGPYGDIAVSPLRERILSRLPDGTFVVSDEMQSIEHSVEAKLPFLQHADRSVSFVPILVPCMSFARMNELAVPLASALREIIDEDGLDWGRDLALVCSTDAVHYGDEAWGDRNFAYFGADEAGYAEALRHEARIMADCFAGELSRERIERFTRYTLDDHDHREYKWTWCGRYSVPLGLLAAWHLATLRGAIRLAGTILGYATSLGDQRIEVEDLDGMGISAPATLRHWVGYAAVGYR
ncbi:MAG TPA: AmmeMemoRadiSam system protein B [Casimicrobiaceae bacterium]|nr:AmmeMemoRadiSam system protein B [Casimicrobiaceae bacterium]